MRPSSVNSLKALATEDWFGIVIMRIQRPRTRIWLTALNDCEPPETSITASVLPLVGRTAPTDRGIQSIWAFMMPVRAPGCSGEHQTMPSDHSASCRSSCTFGCVSGAPSGNGKPAGVEDLDVATQRCQQATVGTLAQRAIEHEEARRVDRWPAHRQVSLHRLLEQRGVECR